MSCSLGVVGRMGTADGGRLADENERSWAGAQVEGVDLEEERVGRAERCGAGKRQCKWLELDSLSES